MVSLVAEVPFSVTIVGVFVVVVVSVIVLRLSIFEKPVQLVRCYNSTIKNGRFNFILHSQPKNLLKEMVIERF